MKDVGLHNDELVGIGFGMWVTFSQLTAEEINSWDELFSKIGSEEKGLLFEILKLISFSVFIASNLVWEMNKQFKLMSEEKKERIKRDIFKKIKRFRRLNERDWQTVAEKMVREQVLDPEEIISTPVLEYLAGYTLGDLRRFAENFSFENPFLEKLEQFVDARNFVLHNPTSTRGDLRQHLKTGLDCGIELKKLLGI
jgi:hypothetical protein